MSNHGGLFSHSDLSTVKIFLQAFLIDKKYHVFLFMSFNYVYYLSYN